jgi:hypothetical protein
MYIQLGKNMKNSVEDKIFSHISKLVNIVYIILCQNYHKSKLS